MTPQQLRTSILNDAIIGKLTNGIPWTEEDDNNIYQFLWEVTYWDKKFKNVDKNKQPLTKNYASVLAGDFPKIEDSSGDVYILSTGLYKGYTSEKKLGFAPSVGEVVSIPGGGSPTVKYWNGKFVTADNRIATSRDASLLSNKYLFYFMLSKIDFLDSIYRGTSLRHPEMPQVLDMRIPVPPIKDQELIVSKIEELQPFVDRYEVAWRKLEALNQKMPADMQKSIVQLAIQGKLVEQRNEEGTGDTLYESIKAEKDQLIKSGLLKREKPPVSISNEEIFYDIPESWRWKRLQSVAKIIVDCPHSTPKYYDEETGYYALGTKCMNSDGEITSLFNVDQATYKKRIERLEPSENDLVYSREGSIVCRAVILPPNKKICLGQRVMLIRCTEHIIPKYMQYYLMSEHTLRFLTRNYKGVGAKHINVADVCALPVPLPPLAEQKRIVAKLEEILPLCERLK